MNLISVETQKKLMYIPIANTINFFILFLNLRRANASGAILIKAFLYILGYGLPIWFLCGALGRLLPDFFIIFAFCSNYLTLISISYGSIKYQEKYLL